MTQLLKMTLAIIVPLSASAYYSSYDLMSYFIGGAVVLAFEIIDGIYEGRIK